MRVLLVDDEERLLDALRRGLAAEGFVVETAATGMSVPFSAVTAAGTMSW